MTLSACETALGRDAGGEGFVGFTQALLMSGARSVCLSLWKVDDTATALLMQRFYANLLSARPGLSQPLRKVESLAEAKTWLRGLRREDVTALVAKLSDGVERAAAKLSGGEARGAGATRRPPAAPVLGVPAGAADDRLYAHPYYWAAFVLAGDLN
ncbi:MAG: CHAT domain-containing protein [Isosphaeraceae bacterium]